MTAVIRREQVLKPVATKVTLEDHGQAFTRFDLDAEGRVVKCIPGDAWLWEGCVVENHRTLRAGQRLQMTTVQGAHLVLEHPAAFVVRLGEQGAPPGGRP